MLLTMLMSEQPAASYEEWNSLIVIRSRNAKAICYRSGSAETNCADKGGDASLGQGGECGFCRHIIISLENLKNVGWNIRLR